MKPYDYRELHRKATDVKLLDSEYSFECHAGGCTKLATLVLERQYWCLKHAAEQLTRSFGGILAVWADAEERGSAERVLRTAVGR